MSLKHQKIMSEFTSDEGNKSIYDPEGFKMNSGSRPSNSEATMDFEDASVVNKSLKSKKNKKRKRRREQYDVVMDLFLALILCHNVTPVYTTVEEQDMEGEQPQNYLEDQSATIYRKKEFQASSPDEVALVKFAESLGMILEEREENFIQIMDTNGQV
jgi:magnesium-transporting ATPase (P-type)